MVQQGPVIERPIGSWALAPGREIQLERTDVITLGSSLLEEGVAVGPLPRRSRQVELVGSRGAHGEGLGPSTPRAAQNCQNCANGQGRKLIGKPCSPLHGTTTVSPGSRMRFCSGLFPERILS